MAGQLPPRWESPWAPFGFIIPESQGAVRKDETAKASDYRPPGIDIPGGLQQGASYLFTGEQLSLHIIRNTSVAAMLKSEKNFDFLVHKVSSNSTINGLIDSLGGNSKSTLTQIFEYGDGQWTKGSSFLRSSGDKRGEASLAQCGWAKAGDGIRQPIWCVLH